MKTMGFPISLKENENRRAIVPDDLANITHTDLLYFQHGYGEVLGFSDEDYVRYGAHMSERNEVLEKDIICDPKVGDADYLNKLRDQTIFGWPHAVQNREIVDISIANKLTVYAWEDMYEQGRHVFWRNNEIAGEAAIMHAFECYGLMPYNSMVALIGRGNVGNGALKILTLLGANVMVYNRKTEALLKEELPMFDVIVNAVLWDTTRKDHIIHRSDLSRMKNGAMIVDISCDKNGGIETSVPTSIQEPTYLVDGILHYVVDHTPALFYKTASKDISNVLFPFIDMLCEDTANQVLTNALSIQDGVIVDKRILEFQNRCNQLV